MTRVLVVGPGPARIDVDACASVPALRLAERLAAEGVTVSVVDASPASALLWPDPDSSLGVHGRRYLRALDAEAIGRIAAAERVDSVAIDEAGDFVLRALTSSGFFGPFYGSTPEEILARKSASRMVEPRSNAKMPPPRVPAKTTSRVLLVGPRERRSSACAAIRLAARAAARFGWDVAVVTEVPGTGAESYARVHVGRTLEEVVAEEAPDRVVHGFGSDPEQGSETFAEPTPNAIELHVLFVADGERARLVGTFEHVERAAVHADDAAAVYPAFRIDEPTLRVVEERATALVRGRKGLVTTRWSVDRELTALGVASGVTMHALSLGLVLGADLVADALGAVLGRAIDLSPAAVPRHVAVEEHVFPFTQRTAGDVVDTQLGRASRSIGSVLSIAETTALAYVGALSAMGAPVRRPRPNEVQRVLLSCDEERASELADVGKRLFALGFDVSATEPVGHWLKKLRVPHAVVASPDEIMGGARRLAAVVAAGTGERDRALRRAALSEKITCFTTIDLARLAVVALEQGDDGTPLALEDWAARSAAAPT